MQLHQTANVAHDVSETESSSSETTEEGPSARTPRQRVASRLVYGSFLGLATAFILSSTFQLVVGVFGVGSEPLAAADPSPAGPDGLNTPSTPSTQACADGIARLSAALDRNLARAVVPEGESVRTEEAALAAFRKGLDPEWTEEAAIQQSCVNEPRGEDAFAALLRLKLAQEGLVRRQMAEIDPLRRNVQAYLPR